MWLASRGLCAAALGARCLNTTSASIQHRCGYKLPLQHKSKTRGCAEAAGGGQSVFRLRNFHSFYYQFYLGLRCPLQARWGVPELSPGSTSWCNGEVAASQLSAGRADWLLRVFSAEFVCFQHPVLYPSCASHDRREEPSSAAFSLKVVWVM